MCGKTAEVSDLQDVLVYCLQGVSFWATQARRFNIINDEIDQWAPKAFFATLTNVNFDPERILALTSTAEQYKTQLKNAVLSASALSSQELDEFPKVADFALPSAAAEILAIAPQVAVNRGKGTVHEDVIGLRLLCLYGLKGAAA